MSSFLTVRDLIGEVLQLGDRTGTLQPSTPLLGHLPELDSLAVVALLTLFEERLGIIIEDDELSAETFATVDSLCAYVDAKRRP